MNSLNKLLQKIDQTVSDDRKPGSGKTRKTRNAQNVALVEELLLSQKYAQGTHRTIQRIAHELDISRSSDRRRAFTLCEHFVSQGSVETCLGSAGNFNSRFVTNFVPIKMLQKF